jgi:hypothetical protein
MENETKIKCPNCGFDLNVNEILYHQLEEDLKQKFNSQLNAERKKFESQADQLKSDREKLEADKKKAAEEINEAVGKRLKAEKEILENEIRKKLVEEDSEKYNSLQKELNDKSEKLKEFSLARAEIEKLKREKNEMKEAIEAESQRTLNEKIQEEKERIRKSESEKNELVIRELQKKLDDQKKLTEEMQRKQDQGSMQTQGEVQELAIEEWLKANFPLDTIEEIKKGQRGADCIQIVNTHTRPGCGKIYYESKRAERFANDWIEKFKADMRSRGINAGILVTQVMPKDMDRMGIKEGIWICSFNEFKGLSSLMRESVIRISEVTASQENKGDKMVMLYDYLISPEFKAQIEAIVEGFTQMKSDLDREKAAMMKIWATREKQIDKVITNTTTMYGSIKGIGGKAIGTVQALELGEVVNDNTGDDSNN